MYLRCSQLHEMVHRDPIGIPWEPRASFDQGCQQSLDEFLVRLWCGGEAQLFRGAPGVWEGHIQVVAHDRLRTYSRMDVVNVQVSLSSLSY